MPKYSSIKGALLIEILEKYGFEIHSNKGSHFTLKNEKTGKRTIIPVHNKPIGKGLLNKILKQCGLDKSVLD